MDAVKMTREITKIKNWLEQNNVDSICFDAVYDNVIAVSLSKRANGRLYSIKHMFYTVDLDLELEVIDDHLEYLAKELNDGIKKEDTK